MTERADHHAIELLRDGTTAPDFSLPDGPEGSVTLSRYRGRPVVLVFYPADWSAVCGDELNVFNEAESLLDEYSAVVLGISVDSVWSHRAFIDARGFRFALLSDFEPKGRVSKLYGAYDVRAGTSLRALFVIDAAGVVAWSYLSPADVNPGVDGVLDALDALTSDTAHSN